MSFFQLPYVLPRLKCSRRLVRLRLVLGADIVRGRRLLEVFLIFLLKIRGADIIRVRILLEGIR